MSEINKNQITGSEAVIKSLLAEGIDVIFGYPGGAIMPIYDALWHYKDKINHVLSASRTRCNTCCRRLGSR